MLKSNLTQRKSWKCWVWKVSMSPKDTAYNMCNPNLVALLQRNNYCITSSSAWRSRSIIKCYRNAYFWNAIHDYFSDKSTVKWSQMTCKNIYSVMWYCVDAGKGVVTSSFIRYDLWEDDYFLCNLHFVYVLNCWSSKGNSSLDVCNCNSIEFIWEKKELSFLNSIKHSWNSTKVMGQ